ncbi:MAG: cytochrome c biogenesis CcdA family protein [Treponema sp.]|jgi:cytochrome c-type biogenesis protein|nr:cytochrome c biogenesis CcdA family protein [Treponema sp.]
MQTGLSVFIAFAAGLLSFFSPCVVPLIPSWLIFLGGGLKPVAGNTAEQRRRLPDRKRCFLQTLCFVSGFSVLFIILGVLLSSAFMMLRGLSRWINAGAGVLVILLGLNTIFDFLSFLNYEKRFHAKGPPRGLVSSFLAGAAFGAGWTPCVGPVLSAILLLASRDGKPALAALYLLCYSLGLGLPFIAAAAFMDRFLRITETLKTRLALIRVIAGILLIIIGIMILTGRFSALNIFLQKLQYSYIDWAEGRGGIAEFLSRWLQLLLSL